MDDIWPVRGIRATAAGIVLHPAVEADLPLLAALLPDDHELDPTIEGADGLPRPLHLLRTYWRDQAAWRTDSPRSASSLYLLTLRAARPSIARHEA